MQDVRVFVSYDVEHDGDLCDRLRAQASQGGSGFAVAGQSESRADPGEARLRRRIDESDEVIVVCGEHTDQSPSASLELRIAQEQEKPYFLLWGRRGVMCTRPASARATDPMYSWTLPILLSQIAATLRHAQQLVVPESCKRAGSRRPADDKP